MLDITASVHKYAPKLVEKLPRPVLHLFIKTIKIIFHEKMFFKLYNRNKHLEGLSFVQNMLDNLHITCTVSPDEMKHIPSTGKLIVIANHPTGAVDTMVLIETIANARENKKIKIVANGMVMGVKQMASLLIPVDNINGAISKQSLKAINKALHDDEAIIIFPAGVVDRCNFRGVKDIPWKSSFLKIAKRTQTPILPLRIEGRNSVLFYIMSILLPKALSSLFLVHEFAIAGKRKPIHINIGQVVPYSSFSYNTSSINDYVEMFYRHLYNINTQFKDILKTQTTIRSTVNTKKLKEEVYKANFLGDSSDGKRIILAEASDSPYLIRELGRLREISFRAIGGGTGKAKDNDKYDKYYKHLVLWDDKDLEVVAAYRIGECKNIIDEHGFEGLYSANQYIYDDEFLKCSATAIELGRSFVQPKYWGSRAFDSLWQAVTIYLAHNPHIQYSYGIVTINKNTPKQASAALVYFYTHYFKCDTQMITPKQPYIMSEANQKEFETLFGGLSYKEGFIVLKKYLKDLNTFVPTFFKQYIELYQEGAARYFGFSVNDGLDGVIEGFLLGDNYRMRTSTQKRHLKGFHKMKDIDGLTKLYSRSYFTHLISSISEYQRKEDTPFSLIVFDIECEFEEDTNNEILIRVANTLKNSLRGDDKVARWDDKSFIIMLKNTNHSQAQSISTNLKSTLEGIKIHTDYKLQCSFKEIELSSTDSEVYTDIDMNKPLLSCQTENKTS
ncbi:MAG TPA: GNAT family N-acetyltransferase [Sulfurimonas sp.]|nr:GNAT family N-acetyltransferase [Sulfurimonas sp.]